MSQQPKHTPSPKALKAALDALTNSQALCKEILAALEAIFKAFDSGTPKQREQAFTLGRAAIAKAKGETE